MVITPEECGLILKLFSPITPGEAAKKLNVDEKSQRWLSGEQEISFAVPTGKIRYYLPPNNTLIGIVGICSGGLTISSLIALLGHLKIHSPHPIQCSSMINDFIFLEPETFLISMASK
jgi:hypothetical protein